MVLRNFILCFAVVLFSQTLLAQTTADYYRIYDRETVRLANEGMIKNGKYQQNVFFNGHLSKELAKTPTAFEIYTQGRGLHNTAATFFILSTATLIITSFTFESDNRQIRNQSATAGTLSITGLILADFIYSRSAVKQSRAVWLYNRSQILENAKALDSTKNHTFIEDNYDRQTIYLTKNRFVQNGKSQRLGFLGNNLGNVLKRNDAAARNYKQFKNRRLWGSILAVVGTGVILASKNPSANVNPNWSDFFLWGGHSITHTGLYISNSGQKKLQEAIWHYNQTATFGEK